MKYYVFSLDGFVDWMDDHFELSDDELLKLWNEIVEIDVGRFVCAKDYIFATSKTIEIDGYTIGYSCELSEWVKYSISENNSKEIFEGWRLNYYEVMDRLLERLDENIVGNGTTYADMIFNAEEPRELVYNLLTEITKDVFEQKLEEMKDTMDIFVGKLEDGSIKWS